METKVAILGATGMVGQNYISLLREHPWFEVSYVAASAYSAGKTFKEAVQGRWHMPHDIPHNIESLVVEDANNVHRIKGKADVVFSAVEIKDKKELKELELYYAQLGLPVFSNNSAHRWTCDIPMLIPEINHAHLDVIKEQRIHYRLGKGFIVVKPNCSIQSFMTPVHALMEAGYKIREIDVVTQQAVSGAGYPGVSTWDSLDNRIPYISGEEEKTEQEPLKIFGKVEGDKIVNNPDIAIYAQCNRDAVRDGHTANVKLRFDGKIPSIEHVLEIWRDFRGMPQEFDLPFAPEHPIIYRREVDRPQPILDRDTEKGMAVTVGKLRAFNEGIMFVGLSHNTIRGAAGGGILNAELLYSMGYFGS